MVLCGHTGNPPKIRKGEEVDYHMTTSYRVDKAADGHEVVQMMFNSQNGDGSWNGNGGDCWLRILQARWKDHWCPYFLSTFRIVQTYPAFGLAYG